MSTLSYAELIAQLRQLDLESKDSYTQKESFHFVALMSEILFNHGNEDMENKSFLFNMSLFWVRSDFFKADVFFLSYFDKDQQILLGDELGKNPMLPLWLEIDDDEFLRDLAATLMVVRFSFFFRRFLGWINAEEIPASKKESLVEIDELARRSNLEIYTSHELNRKFLDRASPLDVHSRMERIAGKLAWSTNHLTLAEIISYDRLIDKMIELGQLKNVHPGVFACLKEDRP